ncbi:MAG: helix-turn-helix domain-containing protein [Collinsella sp.]
MKRDTVPRGVPATVPHGKTGGTMARTAECTAPESNRGCDEWMTVIEMQEYMGASRSKAYDLIWSGEIDSYRLGRKLLVSMASVDAHIESRSGRK